MSITGSLVGYENNNEHCGSGKKPNSVSRTTLNTSVGSMSKPCPSLNSSISNSVITTASSNAGHHQHNSNNTKYQNSKRKSHKKYLQQQQQKDPKSYLHLNSLWSIWYGVLITLFQGYLAVHGAYRFLGCSLIQWKIEPVSELNIQIVLCGVVFILLPLFFTSAVFKVGNLANDGIKLGNTAQKRCSLSPHDGLEEEAKGGTLRALWTHGGPTSAFIHIIIAMCLLLPRLLLEARIIENGLLPRENIWSTEMDFVAVNRRNLVVLSFISSPYQNLSSEEYNDTLYARSNEIASSEEDYKPIDAKVPAFYEDTAEEEEDDYNSTLKEATSSTSTTSTTTTSTSTTSTTERQIIAVTARPRKKSRHRSSKKASSSRSDENRSSRSEEYDSELLTTPADKKDSNIHIVKPEKLPEIVPATPIASNSKIFEIRTKKVKRMVDEELQVEIEPEYLVSQLVNESSPPADMPRLEGFSGMLQTFFGIEKEIDVNVFAHPPSMEFVNLVIALLVWAARYPAVFWATTKPFGLIFTIQMVASAFDIVFGYIGVSNLYKLQIYSEAQPVHNPGLILNGVVTLALFLLSTVLVIASSMIMYLYGHGRLAARMRDRSMISMKTNETWIYFAHCASLCFVLALSVVKAPLLNDLSATYKNNLHCPTFLSALVSVVYLFLWIVIWLGLTAKRRWSFKLPPMETYGIIKGAQQPLLLNRGHNANPNDSQKGALSAASSTDCVEDIYWPKLTPSSPKLKVTFNEVTSTSDDVLLLGDEHDGKRNSTRGAAICLASIAGEVDDGDYATLRGAAAHLMGGSLKSGSIKLLHLSEYDELPPPPSQLLDDNTSEEGKLLACVRDDSVTYASTRDLEPPRTPPPPPLLAPQAQPENMHLAPSPEHMVSPLAPVMVTVHSNEAHITSSSTPRCLRRADSGVPNEALTPRSDTTSTTESTTSPPERAPSESSSGVHSGEERDEVVIRPRVVCKAPPKPVQPVIQEEPYGRSTNMRMSSFNRDLNSATLPMQRTLQEPRVDYSHCSTMPLPIGCHNQYKPQLYSPQASAKHTTLPNGVRYSNPHFLRRMPHVTKAESPYGHLGLGSGHHTFSKLLQDPLHGLAATSIPEDRDSANYSMSSDQDCLYATANHLQ